MRCAYTDGSGDRCATAWCAEHRDSVDRVTYCRRHAGVIRALTPALLDDLPALGNRAPSLVIWVARMVDAEVRELTDRATAGRASVDRVVPEQRDGACVWVVRWRASGSLGSLEVTLEVNESADCVVQLRAGGVTLYSAEPPWITARLQGNPLSDAHLRAARSLFCSEVLNALEAHLAAATLT
ncbi:MAG: hypothetical protein JOY80_08650 [Candidatus Dormibacteraeota bacterium]|nr:hypothetical protein [Candidatus Dormibacteraeota bacterium]